MSTWREPAIWQRVAAELRGYRKAGLGPFLTEDTVRFAAVKAFAAADVESRDMRVEWPHPDLPLSRIDLVVGQPTPQVLLEFKFPREPNEVNAAWTMALGEVLKDLYRLAVYTGDADRIFVHVESVRLRRYMTASAGRYGMDLDNDIIELRPADAARLPTTAARIIGTDLAAHHVTGRRIHLVDIDDSLRISVYQVDAHTTGSVAVPVGAAKTQRDEWYDVPVAATSLAASASVPPRLPPISGQTAKRDGVRREILDAVSSLLTRSGGTTFTLAEIVDEMRRRQTGYAETTIRTMVSSHMCANAPDNAGTTYDDFWRVDRGTYRLR